jgi:hypothetical protein
MPNSVQQQWLQQAALSLRDKTLPPWFEFTKRELVVTLGYSIGGRRAKAPFKVHPKDVEGGIAQDTIFFSPHAYEGPQKALKVLSHALLTLKWAAKLPHEPTRAAGYTKSDIRRLESSPTLQAAVAALEMFLPEFPPLEFCPPAKKQTTRMRLWYCPYHRKLPEGKVRAATDDLQVKCQLDVSGLPCGTKRHEVLPRQLRQHRSSRDSRGPMRFASTLASQAPSRRSYPRPRPRRKDRTSRGYSHRRSPPPD